MRFSGQDTEATMTRYALGVRGIDGIETTTVQGASAVYPVYDGHGNMIATLARNGTSFARANNREYGVWGDIRSGSGGDQGYVANLGHRKDAESGLTYMRARYYEPGTGRFISQDRAYHGLNWYSYANNNPNSYTDFSGNAPDIVYQRYAILGFILSSWAATLFAIEAFPLAMGTAIVAVGAFAAALGGFSEIYGTAGATHLSFAVGLSYTAVIAVMGQGVKYGMRTRAGVAVLAMFAYGLAIIAALISTLEGCGYEDCVRH